MAFRSSKHRQVVPEHINPIGGLRLDVPPQSIATEELTVAHNMMYMPGHNTLSTRPAFRSLANTPLNAELKNMIAFEGELYISTSIYRIYRFNLSSQGYTFVSNTNSGSAVAFLVFNNKLLWVDGSGIYSWDGSTKATLTTAIKPTAISEILSRVVVNDTLDPDAVYFSGPEDETDWDTSAGAAVGIRAGYGDGMAVNALAVLGQDVLVSKVGLGKRFIYRCNTAGVMPEQWQTMKLVSDTAAIGPLLFAPTPNDVLYINEDYQLRALSGITQYGDIRSANAGEKINPALSQLKLDGKAPSLMRYLPSLDAMAGIFSGTVGLYYPEKMRFTMIDLLESGSKILCCCDMNNEPFWGSDTGQIYQFSESQGDDSTSFNSAVPIGGKMRTKLYHIQGDVIIRRVDLGITSLAKGHGIFEIVRPSQPDIILFEFDLEKEADLLYSANGLLNDANDFLYEGGAKSEIIMRKNRARVQDFYFQVRTISGRMAINSIDVTMAIVNG